MISVVRFTDYEANCDSDPSAESLGYSHAVRFADFKSTGSSAKPRRFAKAKSLCYLLNLYNLSKFLPVRARTNPKELVDEIWLRLMEAARTDT